MSLMIEGKKKLFQILGKIVEKTLVNCRKKKHPTRI